jgi:hypothetical protein
VQLPGTTPKPDSSRRPGRDKRAKYVKPRGRIAWAKVPEVVTRNGDLSIGARLMYVELLHLAYRADRRRFTVRAGQIATNLSSTAPKGHKVGQASVRRWLAELKAVRLIDVHGAYPAGDGLVIDLDPVDNP